VKGTAYAFAGEVDREIESFSKTDYLERKGRCKRLLEEILPISRLALSLKRPGCEVEVEAFEDSGPVDGRIRISGFLQEEFSVEVTYVYDYEDSLRGELLSLRGFTPGFGPIQRDKQSRHILAEGEATDTEETLQELAAGIFSRFQRKSARAVTPNTDLIIGFDDVTVYGYSLWARLIESLRMMGGLSGSSFRRVFLINCATNQVVQVACSRT
jgi:hypothetical protein